MIIAHHPKSQDKTLCGVVHSAHPHNELRPITPRGRRPWCVDDASAFGWGEDMTQAMVVGAKAAGHHNMCWMWKACHNIIIRAIPKLILCQGYTNTYLCLCV